MLDEIFIKSPVFIQNLMITGFNIREYRKRYGGVYKSYLKQLEQEETLSLEELRQIQNAEWRRLVDYVREHCTFYKNLDIPESDKYDLNAYPIITKETLRNNIKDFYTIDKSDAIVSKTGGTTGKSLTVLYTKEDVQKRYSFLDHFRKRAGYELGKKTAWFSGKAILNDRDMKNNVFWKTDNYYKVRYYSTFHMKNEFMKFYIENLNKYKPEYLVGFPSSMVDIARFGLYNGLSFEHDSIKAIFPTAETVTQEVRNDLEKFFKAKVYDQYASSEGAPFIFECSEGNLHLELRSGIFEVLDENNNPAMEGNLILTSFTTYGTPLIRYNIGDRLLKSNRTCICGNNNPLVERIMGRIDDFIYSPQNGKINLGNVSNTLKNTKGIKRFQVVQEELNAIKILLEIDERHYTETVKATFLKNWRDRVGPNMNITLTNVENIPVAKSGKFRIVINKIKHLI